MLNDFLGWWSLVNLSIDCQRENVSFSTFSRLLWHSDSSKIDFELKLETFFFGPRKRFRVGGQL